MINLTASLQPVHAYLSLNKYILPTVNYPKLTLVKSVGDFIVDINALNANVIMVNQNTMINLTSSLKSVNAYLSLNENIFPAINYPVVIIWLLN